jgi:hypothetical protein
MSTIKLTEPGVKYFLKESLIICNKKRIQENNIYFNLVLLILFFTILGVFLYYRSITKEKKNEKKKTKKKKQNYFLEKIKQINDNTKKQLNMTITNLPKFESEFRTDTKIFL